VLHAFEATQQADREVSERYRHWITLGEESRLAVASGHLGAAHEGETMLPAHRAIRPALEEADVKDQALIKVICDQLRSKPEAALTMADPPPPATQALAPPTRVTSPVGPPAHASVRLQPTRLHPSTSLPVRPMQTNHFTPASPMGR
jgi:hypothetical protein